MNASLPQSVWHVVPDTFSVLHLPHPAPLTPSMHERPSDAADAGVLHARVLLNCYAREVAMQEHQLAVRSVTHTHCPPLALRQYAGQVLDIQLPRMQQRICVGVRHVSVTGNYDYLTAVYLQDAQKQWQTAGWDDIARLIIADLSAREGTPFNQDLLQQITESVSTMQSLLHAPSRNTATQAESALLQYIRSEQSLLTGHPFHPTPKSRSGWSQSEEQQYSPEHGASMQLRYFSVPSGWIISDSLDGGSAAERLQGLSGHGLQAEEGQTIMPLHPWQADWMLQQPRIQTAIGAGHIRDLGSHGKHFFPTASIRTMVAGDAEAFLKLSLNMRITNCIRNNARHELAAALTATRLYRQVRPAVQALFPHFHVLEEQAYLSLSFPEDRQSSERPHKEIEDGFGMVIREGLGAYTADGSTPLVCASLFGNGQTGRLQVAALIEKYAHRHGLTFSQGIRQWFSQYAQMAVFPVFYLLFEKGIAFEPHMQNSLLRLAADGAPAGFMVRDLELTRLTPQAHALLDAAQDAQQAHAGICCSNDAGWTRIAYCLLVNNICEVIATLANGNHERYLELWACLRHTLQSYLLRFPGAEAARRIQGLLSGEPLPVKGNLLIRFLKQADRKAAYLPLYHPLGVVNEIR